ncbi:O(6)-methylguanine-induced apoptosis 2-like [Oopsacas minuta]|uniref:O(6)-methylguanine-induced apoptosis 2-like n=1 Tax=Oopsacas minuta TaxID=111878 RepID=A0AAV7KGY0_9METZ|nr:O(6)-methylguanine-induced apoptosis 2-like [Oopsacas minuta]
MAVFSLTPLYSVPSPSPVPQSEFSEDIRLRTTSRALRTGRVSASALSQRSRPESPCPASIPSKYRTVFYQLTENKGFQMQSPRFDSNRYFTDVPSPGSYDITHDTLIRNTTSLSTKGTCNFGSKTKRFSKAKTPVLGPASYFPILLKKDFNQSKVSRLFKEPTTQQVLSDTKTPSPNKYDLRSTEYPEFSEDYSIFKSKTPRIIDTAYSVYSNPGPGQYNIDDSSTHSQPIQYSSVFKSKSTRAGVHDNKLSPGPADYFPYVHTKQQNKSTHTV